MAVSFARSWGDEVADVSERAEYQTCVVQIVDPTLITGGVYDVATDTYSPITNKGVLYEGQARYIPVRFGVFQEAGGQANTTSLRAGRVQLPRSERNLRVDSGCKVFFVESPFNGTLSGRSANVTDDFQGSTTGSRTINVLLDADTLELDRDGVGEDG